MHKDKESRSKIEKAKKQGYRSKREIRKKEKEFNDKEPKRINKVILQLLRIILLKTQTNSLMEKIKNSRRMQPCFGLLLSFLSYFH